jgi:hypothetical protein
MYEEPSLRPPSASKDGRAGVLFLMQAVRSELAGSTYSFFSGVGVPGGVPFNPPFSKL